MTRRQRVLVGLITWIPVLAVLAAGALHMVRQVEGLIERADELVAEEIQRRIGRQMTIGRSELKPLGVAVFSDVQVAEKADGSDGTLLRVRKVVIRYDWRGVLLRGAGLGGISRVTIEGPLVSLVRRPDGTLNIQDLLKPQPGPAGPPFRGELIVSDGEVRYTDYVRLADGKPQSSKLRKLDLRLDASDQPEYSFALSCIGEPGRAGNLKAVGVFRSRARSLTADVSVDSLSLPYVSGFASMPPGYELLAGSLRTVLGINVDWSKEDVRVDLIGSARLSSATVRLPGIRRPVEDVAGELLIDGRDISGKLTGELAGSKFAVYGTADGLPDPVLDVSLLLPGADFQAIAAAVPLPRVVSAVRPAGRGRLAARVTGRVSDPRVEVSASVPRVVYQDYLMRGVEGSAVFTRKAVEIISVRFSTLGAQVSAAGNIQLGAAPRLALRGRVSNLALSALSSQVQVPLVGTASGVFAISGVAASPNVTVAANAGPGEVSGIGFDSVRAQFGLQGSRVLIRELAAAGIAGGTITASGTADRRDLNLRVSAEAVDVSELAPRFGVEDLEGVAFLDGIITGSPSDPLLSGKLEVFEGRAGRFDFDFARAEFSGGRARLDVSRAVVGAFPAELELSGTLDGVGGPQVAFRGSGRLERMRAADLLELLGSNLDVTGTITADIRGAGVYRIGADAARGRLENTSVETEFRLEDGSAYGLLIDSADAAARIEDGRFVVRELTLTSQDAVLSVSGTVGTDDGIVGLRFSLDDFDVSRLADVRARPGRFDPSELLDRLEAYGAAAGRVSVEGTVTGRLADPEIALMGRVEKLTVNRKTFDEAAFDVLYTDRLVSAFNATLRRKDQSLEIHGVGYDPSSNLLDEAVVSFEQVSVPDLWDMFRASPYLGQPEAEEVREAVSRIPRLTSGRLDGVVRISGNLAAPDGSAHLTATHVGIEIQKLDSVVADLSAEAGRITLDQLRAVSEDTLLVVTGDPLYHDGKLNLDLNAQNLNLARLRPWLADRTPGGIMSADFNISGDARTPKIIGSVEVVDPVFSGLSFERLRASTIEFVEGRVDLSGIILSWAGHQIEATGYLPWEWAGFAIPPDAPLEIEVRMREQDLSMLDRFVEVIDAGGTRGRVQANLLVTGTPAEVRLDGGVDISDGKLALKGFVNTFTDVNTSLAFEGSRLVVRTLSARSSLGGSVRVEPGGSVTLDSGPEAGANLVLVADGLVLEEHDLLGFQERVRLKLDAGLAVSGPLNALKVSDAPQSEKVPVPGVLVSSARAAFRVPEEVPEREDMKFALNPSLDINLRLGDDVWVAPPSMALLLQGGGRIGGSLEKPDINLDLEAGGGTIRLAAARLRLEPGGRITVKYAPADVRVDLRAVSSVIATSPLGRRERYRIYVDVAGPLANLQINLSSVPAGLTRTQILAALGHVEGIFTSGEAGLQRELGSVLSAVGAGALLAPIETLFVEQFGFEEFALEVAPAYPLSLYFTRHLFGNFYLSFYRRLTGRFASTKDIEYQTTLSYRLRNRWEFGVGIDDQQTTSLSVGLTTTFR